MAAEVEILVSAPIWREASDAEDVVRRAIGACEATLGDRGESVEVSVLLCDDLEIRRLNSQWRSKDSATNVLSFPAPSGPSPQLHLGDIAIAYETVAREAKDERKPFSAHLAHMAVHGYLHLSGYDHEDEDEAEEMEQLEREILAELGVSDPYDAPAAYPPGKSQTRQ